MKEIVVISGKGGTGKTSITASLAYLGGNEILVADCDVDAADLHLLLNPDFAKEEESKKQTHEVIYQGFANIIPIRGKESSLDYYLMVLSTEVFS